MLRILGKASSINVRKVERPAFAAVAAYYGRLST
jgi:hypothetical protein